MLPTGDILPLKQDIENILRLYGPLHRSSQQRPIKNQHILQRQISKGAAQQEINIKEYDYNSDDSDSVD